MVSVKKISKTELIKLVEISYEGDTELFEKFHVGKFDFFQSVVSTLQMIQEMSKQQKLSYYKVISDKKPIGYFVTYQNVLYSFGIAKNFRLKEVLISWIEQVKKVLGKQICSFLYDNNTRAIDFLLKNGFRIANENLETKVITLINY